MTYPFQTDNVFYVPPQKPFCVYDLLGWRRIELCVQSTRLRLDPSAGPAVRQRAAQALKLARSLPQPIDMPSQEARMNEFLGQLPFSDSLPHSSPEFEKAFFPLRPTFWARLSQQPMESFFHEDYEETPLPDDSQSSTILTCMGAVAFNAIGQDECELPSAQPLRLSAPSHTRPARVLPLDPFEPLPLVREYCGCLGSSNQGELVTIDLRGQIPEACLAAVPIRRTGLVSYETLYMHLPLETETPPTRPFRRSQSRELAKALRAKGFQPERRMRRFSTWTRGGDVIQVYRDLPGKESESVPVLPSFCLAALADGSPNRAARHALLNEILGK